MEPYPEKGHDPYNSATTSSKWSIALATRDMLRTMWRRYWKEALNRAFGEFVRGKR